MSTTLRSFAFSFFLLPAVQLHGQEMAQQVQMPGASTASRPWQYSQQTSDIRMPDAASNNSKPASFKAVRNYTTFTAPVMRLSAEALAANKGYERHPEAGLLFAGAPCKDCYELIGARTETTKTFVKEGTINGYKEKMVQTSTHPLHYKDANGNWKTVRVELQRKDNQQGVYSVENDATPIFINTNAGSTYTALGKNQDVKFNNRLELAYLRPDGVEVPLGAANWKNYTAGDQGVYVTNAWPGIDMEISVLRGALKTNFYINQAMPQYAAGKLLVKDHIELNNNLTFHTEGGGKTTMTADGKAEMAGDLMIKDRKGVAQYGIATAVAYEKADSKNTLKQLVYRLGGDNTIDIVLPGDYLNRPAASYPVVIDPLVSTVTSIPVAGSSYNASWAVGSGCLYTNPAWTPINATLTGIQFQFQYTAVAPMAMQYGAYSFYIGACRNPANPLFSWSCASPATGTCTAAGGAAYDIFSSMSACLPPPSCASIALNVQMYFYHNWAPTAPCVSTYCFGSQPLIITVLGRTLEFNSATASPSTICLGSSSTLTGSGSYGVPPYTYSWTPGPVSGSPAVVSPTTTTNYALTITDACGITATGNTTVTVNTAPPITGTLMFCEGTTSALSNSVGGTWTSNNTAVATITSPAGVATGVAPGTATITFTANSTGCYTTTVVTVTPLPTAISGANTVCLGSTATLSNSAPWGTWTSSSPGTASVGGTSGVVTGIATGTVTITYGSPGCFVTRNMTVDVIPAITGTLHVCEGSTTTLSNPSPGGTWLSTNTAVATISGSNGIVNGVANGTTTISYTIPSGCYTTSVLTVDPLASITGAMKVCMGANTVLNASVTGGTWLSGATAVATIDVGSGLATGIAAGTSMMTYTTPAGCLSTVVVTVAALPPAPTVEDVDYCQHAAATVLTAGGASLRWYTAATGGTGSTFAPLPSTAVDGIYPWYVTQTVNGCESPRAVINVNVHIRPDFNIVAARPFVCQHDTISLFYSGPAVPGQTYFWTLPWSGQKAIGALETNPFITLRFDTTMTNNSVVLIIDNGYAPCRVADTLPITVYLNSLTVNFASRQDICVRDSVSVALTNRSNGINDYAWDFAGGSVVTASSNHGGPYIMSWNTPGVYTLSVTPMSHKECPSKTVYNTIHVHPLPDAAIAPAVLTANSNPLCSGDSVMLSVANYKQNNAYAWEPAIYFYPSATGNNVWAKLEKPGDITLTVTDPFGCARTESMYFDVQPCCTVTFPTAFTPNGDNINDVFRPITAGNHKMHQFIVQNRWGQTVFETVNERNGWDGRYNGVPQDMGVYTYFIWYDCDGKTIKKKGDLTLVR